MIDAFKRLCKKGLTGWEFHLVGGVAPGKIHAEYLDRVKRRAQGYPIFIHTDAPFSELKQLYDESSIYWHASGYGRTKTETLSGSSISALLPLRLWQPVVSL